MGRTLSTKIDRRVASWIANRVDRQGISRSEFLRRLIANEMKGDGMRNVMRPHEPAPRHNPAPPVQEADPEPGPRLIAGIPVDTWVEVLAQQWLEGMDARIEAIEERFEEIPRLRALAEDLQKEIREETCLGRLDALIHKEEELKQAFDELSVKVSEWEDAEGRAKEPEKVCESPPEDEPTIRVVLADDVDRRKDSAEEQSKVSPEVVARIGDRVREAMAEDLMGWRERFYAEVKDEVKEHLSALQDSDDALTLRIIRLADSVESLATSVDALFTKEVAAPRVEPRLEVEAKTGLAPPMETLKDILVICGHGRKGGRRTGFTIEDKRAGVTFCPQCGRRVTYT